MSVTARVIKNSSLLMMASLINNVMTFILTLFTARYLGTHDFGLISSATSLVGVFGIFCDLGLSTYAIREVSRNRELTGVYFGTTLLFRVLFTLITFVIYVLFIANSNFSGDGTIVMLLFGLYMVFNSFATFYYSLFQSNEKMKYQTIGNVIYSTSVLLIILVIIYQGSNVTIVAAGYPIAMFLSCLYSTYIALRYYPKFKLSLEKSFIRNLFVKGIPFGITAVFTSIYFWISLIILTFMSGSIAVGLFSSAQKLLLVLSSIFTLFNNAVFPIMSDLYTSDREKLVDLYHKIMKYMLMLGMAVAVGCCLFSDDIITLVYGMEYIEASTSLSILIWAGVFMFLTSVCSTLLGAINKQFTVTKIAGIGAFVSIVLNYFMISNFSYYGASYSTVITEFSILSLMLLVLYKTEFKLNFKEYLVAIIQIILANVIMAVVLIYLNQSFIVS
ncbi:MAG: flippase, partial [Methanosphaera sp.]|nr:flippase [Methanosphaera sp.]